MSPCIGNVPSHLIPIQCSLTPNLPRQKSIIRGAISCSPLLQSGKVFGKNKVFKMGMRKTWPSKNPITLCYPGKGQHELTASTDPSPGMVLTLTMEEVKAKCSPDVDSKAKDQGGRGPADLRLDSPRLKKKLATCTGDVGQFPSFHSILFGALPHGLVLKCSLVLPRQSSTFLTVLTGHYHFRCSLSSALILLCR